MEMNQFDEQFSCSNVWPNHEVLWASGQCWDLDGYFAGHLWAFFGSKLAVYGLPAGFGKTNLLFDGVGSKNEPIFSTKKCHDRVNPAHNVNQCFFSISLFRLLGYSMFDWRALASWPLGGFQALPPTMKTR